MFKSASDLGTLGRLKNKSEFRDITDVFVGFFPAHCYSTNGLLKEMAERSRREHNAPLELTHGKWVGISAGWPCNVAGGLNVLYVLSWLYVWVFFWFVVVCADIVGLSRIAL